MIGQGEAIIIAAKQARSRQGPSDAGDRSSGSLGLQPGGTISSGEGAREAPGTRRGRIPPQLLPASGTACTPANISTRTASAKGRGERVRLLIFYGYTRRSQRHIPSEGMSGISIED